MKVTELLDLARTLHDRIPWERHRPSPDAPVEAYLPAREITALAGAVIDLLGESAPCGFDEPELAPAIAKPTMLWVPATWAAWVTADDARAMGRMLFRAADEAEGK